jgi:hypothetical protein
LDTAVAVPATTAVRAIIPNNPMTESQLSTDARAASTASLGILAWSSTTAPEFSSAVRKGAAQVFSQAISAMEELGSRSSPRASTSSASSRPPGTSPSTLANSGPYCWVIRPAAPNRPRRPGFVREKQVEHADRAGGDQLLDMGGHD